MLGIRGLLPKRIKRGQKIAQLLPRFVMTDAPVLPVFELPKADRGDKGFGSSGT